MARLSDMKPAFLKTGALAALAASLVLTAMPVQAQDGQGRRQRDNAAAQGQVQQAPANNWSERRQQRQSEGNSEARMERRAERAAAAQAAPPAESARQRYWNGRNENTGVREQADVSARQAPGWQRRAERTPQAAGTDVQPQQRRDWSRDRNENRQDQSGSGREWANRDRPNRDWQNRDWQNRDRAENNTRDGREWAGRNRTYTDPSRNSDYRGNARDDNRDGRWQNRDGRWQDRDNNNRDGRWNSRNGYRNGHNAWNHNWRHNNRYNWQGYRSSNRNIYRIGRYYAPYRSYYYRPLSIGFQLESLFFSSRYWINDPWQYRLPAADGPYRWVRYYDDVLLVDIYSGEVVDVIRNFFW